MKQKSPSLVVLKGSKEQKQTKASSWYRYCLAKLELTVSCAQSKWTEAKPPRTEYFTKNQREELQTRSNYVKVMSIGGG